MFPRIPFGTKKVGDYIIPKRGKPLLSKDTIEGSIPVVAGGISSAGYHNESNTTAPVLTISASGANAGYINLWHDAVWSSDSSYIDGEMSKDVYFWYGYLKKRQENIFNIQTGSAQPHIYPYHIAELPIAEVDMSMARKYSVDVKPLYDTIRCNLHENNVLYQLRDWLLPMLMNGQATISD